MSKALDGHFKALQQCNAYQNYYLTEIAKCGFSESVVNMHILNSVNKPMADIVYGDEAYERTEQQLKEFAEQLHAEAIKFTEGK